MPKVYIVEDEPRAYEELASCLSRFGREHGVSFSVVHLPSADDFIEAMPEADLIFMDIDMPGTNGLDGARAIRKFAERVPLVFVTNLAQYAIRGYEVDAIDFIVKPVVYATFAVHMERIMRLMGRTERRSIPLKTTDGTRMVALDDISCVEVDKHYLKYHLAATGETIRVRGTISAAEEQLGGGRFVRVSVSHIVNIGHIATLLPDSVVLDDGTVAYFSRSRKREASRKIADYFGGDA